MEKKREGKKEHMVKGKEVPVKHVLPEGRKKGEKGKKKKR